MRVVKAMVLILMPVLMIVDVAVEIVTEVLVPVLFNLVGWCLVREKSLDIVMLHTVFGLMFYVVEELVIFVLNVLHEFLTVVIFHIVLVLMMIIVVIELMIAKITLPVGMVCVSMMSEQRVMNGVVSSEVSIVLDAVNVVVLIMPWLELM